MRTRVCISLFLFLLSAAITPAGAQQFTGGVRGAVRDANGVIPGATVTLTNEATNISRDVVTNDVGQFNFPAVAPGTYTVRAQIAGYKRFESKGLTVATQQFITVDIVLALGAIEESVTVTGQSPLIETSNASTGASLDRQTLETLPAPGRNAFLIGVTIPTVMPNGDPQFNRQQDQSNASLISIGGGGIRANNYLVDGVPITELRGRAVANPTIEALEDVKVQVHTYDAEMGRTGGGVFNVTARSGSNSYHGSGFYQTRPVWGQSENYFNDVAGKTKEETGLSDAYYRLYGGGIGGPVVKNRTFFWFGTEGYRSGTTRNINEIWPTTSQRNGDFSRTTAGGSPITLYNPWCRGGAANARCPATGTGSIATGGLFTGAIIPLTHPAVSQVGLNILKLWPTETIQGPMAQNENGNTNANGTAFIVDKAGMYTFKGEHKFTDNWSLSGFYLYNKTDEPGSSIMKADKLFIADQDQWFGPLRRRPHVLVFNNTNVLNDSTVMTLRYGWTTWQDSCDSQPFSAGQQSLGFNPAYVNALPSVGKETFPSLAFQAVEDVGGWGPGPVRWKGPYAINGAVTKLKGTHSYKVGADFRRLGVELATVCCFDNSIAGNFDFDANFTGRSGVANSGNEIASLLLGLPSSGSAPYNEGAGEWFTKYWGVYIQDDWRVNSKFTLNYGLRLEHEDGLREVDNKQTVGFDQNVTNPIDSTVPKQGTLLQGKTLKGGLIFAGVDGANDYLGNPKAIKPAPRVGATYAMDTNTVFRGGYGLYWAPWNYPGAGSGYISTGFSRRTAMIQSAAESSVPLTILDNPFPSGLQAPIGSSLGYLTNVGGRVDFVDQNKGNPKVHQYSIDVQRQLRGAMAVTIGYVGATGRDIGYGGVTDALVNINQIDPAVARQNFPLGNGWDAAKLREQVANPFFGIAAAGELASAPTVARGQLLRPFPEFQDIYMHQKTDGSKRQYNALELMLDKRVGGSQRWGGRFSYTYSQMKDNQFGESTQYGSRTSTPQNNYDLNAEYGLSNFDSPHRLILAPMIQLPNPAATSGASYWLASGWNISAVMEFVSGPPLNAIMSSDTSDANLGLLGGRQRPNLIGDPNTTGSDQDRAASDDHSSARWFNAAAFASPGVGQYGTAARTDGDARWQFRKNIDVVFAKNTRFNGDQNGEIRFEILNLTNTPKFGNYPTINAVNLSSFGRVDIQAGFMRIWQLTFRYRF